jgi:hypothetical protein
MMEDGVNASPRLTARLGGLFYLLMFVSGGIATFARRGIIVPGDAAATAAHISAHGNLWQVGFAGDVLVVATYVAVTAFLYQLLKPVNRSVALLAAFLSLTGCAVQGVSCAFELAPLAVVKGAPYLRVFSATQLPALAYLLLKLYGQTYNVALVFFAFYDFLIGWLVFRSTFMPRIVGVLMMIAGVAGLSFLSPTFGPRNLPYIIPFSAGEAVLTLWLVIKAVNADRWKERARAAGMSIEA